MYSFLKYDVLYKIFLYYNVYRYDVYTVYDKCLSDLKEKSMMAVTRVFIWQQNI